MARPERTGSLVFKLLLILFIGDITRDDDKSFSIYLIPFETLQVNFTNMRVTVNEMWMKGAKVACGVVGESTKVVYLSVVVNVFSHH